MLERVSRGKSSADSDAADVPAAPILIYAINLDRSVDRWERLRGQAVRYGLNVVRITAVDGSAVPEQDRVDFHPHQFVYHNGRRLLAGEYGCYRSHLMAMEQFVDSGHELAIIIEDDVDLNPRLIQRAIAAITAAPDMGLVKLVNHRAVGFKPHLETSERDIVGRCLHGPQGSAACYILTRKAAQKLLVTLRPMLLPFDVALERGWSTGVQTFSMEKNIVEFSPFRGDTAIGRRVHYRAVKKHFMLRVSAHWFRTHDQVRRWYYAVKMRKMLASKQIHQAAVSASLSRKTRSTTSTVGE
ncbi:glycosyl transferase [Neorhizobium sp. P12A]|nr:glycosyl transferase [Neorhizobium sp. P12A]